MVDRRLLQGLVENMEVTLTPKRIGRRPRARPAVLFVESLTTGERIDMIGKPDVVKDLEAWLDQPPALQK